MSYRPSLAAASRIVAASQAIAWGTIVSSDWPPSGYPLDDAWIHELIARNLVQHGVLGVSAHLYGSGATSVLWALLLAAGTALRVPPPWFSDGLNLLLLLFTGQVILRLLVNDGMAVGKATVLAVVFGAAPNYVWFALSGMEATLAVFASVAAVACWFSPHQRVRHLSGVAAAILSLTRPEGILIVPVLLVLRMPTSRDEWISCGLVPVSAVSANALANLMFAGRLLPSTFSGRRWLWLASRQDRGAVDLVRDLISGWMTRLEDFTLGRFAPRWVVLGAAAVGAFVTARFRALRALVVWALVWFGIYAVALPTAGHAGRYQPLVPSLFLLLCCAGLLSAGRLLHAAIPGNRRLLTAALLALAATIVWKGPASTILTWREDHRDAVRHVNDTEVATGVALRSLPVNARIASFDIGGIGYFSDREILDLGGLTDNSIVPLLWQGRVADYVKAARVDYLVLPIGFGPLNTVDGWNLFYRLNLAQSPELGLEAVARRASTNEVWSRASYATLNASPAQVIFRVNLSRRPTSNLDAPVQ